LWCRLLDLDVLGGEDGVERVGEDGVERDVGGGLGG
jgi:hypothetical protein